MKKVLFLLLTLCVFSSCQQKLTRPLKGNYPGDYTEVSFKSTNQIWDSIIQYCKRNGIEIKLMDRKSGLIVSQPYAIKTYTFENPDGIPKNLSANVIIGCETVGSFKNDCQKPVSIWANINFKLNEESNKTLITLRLSELRALYSYNQYLKEIKSTGFLEKQIIDNVK